MRLKKEHESESDETATDEEIWSSKPFVLLSSSLWCLQTPPSPLPPCPFSSPSCPSWSSSLPPPPALQQHQPASVKTNRHSFFTVVFIRKI